MALTAAALLPIAGCDPANGPAGPADTSEILLVYPKGGETLKVGSTLTVKWAEQGQGKTDVNAVDVMLSPDGGKSWFPLMAHSIKPGAPEWEKFPWVIPDTFEYVGNKYPLANNAKCRIKVDQYTDPKAISEASGDFAITP
jgi:hypothetical protein